MEEKTKIVNEKTTGALNDFMNKACENYDLPGLAIGVSFKDYGFKGASGFKNFETKAVLKPTDIFHMASVTKLLVGTSILQLWEQGALELEDRVIEHLPWFSMTDGRFNHITIDQLLSHTAGMPDVTDYNWDNPETDEGALERYIRSSEVKNRKLLWNPEEKRFSYSNIGYEILGAVICSVSGMPFEEYVKRNIFIPFNMNNSELLMRFGNMQQVCTPHKKDAEKRIVREPVFPYNRAHSPSSTFTSNLEDLEKFARGILGIYKRCEEDNSQVMRRETLKSAWEEIALVPNNGEHICRAWFKREQVTKDEEKSVFTLYGHEGTDNGFRASFWLCPKLDMHIAVCSNISNAPVKKINKQVFEILLKSIE